MPKRETPLQAAVNAREDADNKVGAVLRQQYPIGAIATWEHGARILQGRVVEHLYGERIRVRNVNTGKPADIRAGQIARGEGHRK